MLKGGLTNPQIAPHGLRVSTQVYGKTVKWVCGLTTVSPDLIWANDWKSGDSTANPALQSVLGNTGSSSKKSGKKSNPTYYSAAVNMLLGLNPILGVLSVYYNNQKFNCPIISASGVVSGGTFTLPDIPAGRLDLGLVEIGGGNAAIAGIVAVTVAESYSATFNDFGGPGEQTVSGTWNRPLWNSAFAVPGHIDPETAFNVYDPYTFSWDDANTITVPTALNGKTITVYYGVPQILKSNGQFFGSSMTPLALLGVEFEFHCGSGSEYVNHQSQQVINTFCAGVGSPKFDLGLANAVPNLNFECIGSFTCWPNGDADISEMITDIVTSGPILLGAN